LEESKNKLNEEEIRLKNELRILLLSFIFIIQNIKKVTLKKWFKFENKLKIHSFFNKFIFIINVFQYTGIIL
jgi:hypothetical protein